MPPKKNNFETKLPHLGAFLKNLKWPSPLPWIFRDFLILKWKLVQNFQFFFGRKWKFRGIFGTFAAEGKSFKILGHIFYWKSAEAKSSAQIRRRSAEKKTIDFPPKNQVKKSKMADFSKNTCPDKMILLLQDTSLWAPQTPIIPIMSSHLPPPISSFEILENRPQNNIFHVFFKKSLKYLSDHLSDVLKWKYGPSAFQRTFSHGKILKTRKDTPFWSHVPKGVRFILLHPYEYDVTC